MERIRKMLITLLGLLLLFIPLNVAAAGADARKTLSQKVVYLFRKA